ncbi:MAG: hypothetical protein ABSG99_05945 [Sedimentisphaerales bacterium]
MRAYGRAAGVKGFLVFSNGFPREQKYGKEIIDRFNGLVRYVCSECFDKYRIIKAEVDYSSKFLFDDGILVLMKGGKYECFLAVAGNTKGWPLTEKRLEYD